MSAPEDQEDTLDEVFVGEDGDDIGDGRVVADLDDGNGGVDEEDEEPDTATGEDMGEGQSAEEEEPVEEMSEHCFEGHTDPVVSVAWSPTGADLVATGGCDDKAYIWRVGQDAYHETGGETFELAGHTDTICSLAFDSTGAMLATGGMDGKVNVWTAATGALLSTLEGSGAGIEWVRWHPRGGVVLAGAEDFTAWMWVAETGACMQVFSGHNGPVSCGAFTADGRLVITGGGENDSSLRVWNPKTGECTTAIQGSSRTFHEDAITALDVHADCQTVLTGSADGRAFLTNIASGRVVGALEGHSDSVEAVGFCPVLPLATTAGVDGLVKVWDQQTLSMRGECEHPGPLTTLKCHPSQPLVITGCLDGAVRVWDLRTASRTACLTGHSDGVQAIALSPDGSMVISGGDDNQARVFKLQQ